MAGARARPRHVRLHGYVGANKEPDADNAVRIGRRPFAIDGPKVYAKTSPIARHLPSVWSDGSLVLAALLCWRSVAVEPLRVLVRRAPALTEVV